MPSNVLIVALVLLWLLAWKHLLKAGVETALQEYQGLVSLLMHPEVDLEACRTSPWSDRGNSSGSSGQDGQQDSSRPRHDNSQ